MNPNVDRLWQTPPVSDDALNSLESSLGIRLPATCRIFLNTVANGGRPSSSLIFDCQDGFGFTRLQQIFGVHDGDDSLQDRYFALQDLGAPKNVLPVAEDPFGNLVVLVIQQNGSSPAYFWDHEETESLLQDPTQIKLADSFDAFLKSLQPFSMANLRPAEKPVFILYEFEIKPANIKRTDRFFDPAQWQNTHGLATVEQIDAIHQKLGFQIPHQYANFLMTVTGGGSPVQNYVLFNVPDGSGPTDLRYFFGIQPGYDYLGNKVGEGLPGEMPEGCLPISEDSLGNTVFLMPRPDGTSAVYFWEHEEFDILRDDPTRYKLANSFEEFVDQLYVEELDPT